MAAELKCDIVECPEPDFQLNPHKRYSQYSTNSSRAIAFVETISGEHQQQQSPPPSVSISLDLMRENDSQDGPSWLHSSAQLPDTTTASVPDSLKVNYDLASMKQRLRARGAAPLRYVSLREESPSLDSPEARRQFDFVQFKDFDEDQREEFEKLLKKESGCYRSWFHKGFIINAVFLVILIVGVVLGEIYFPNEGIRGRGVSLMNDTNCIENIPACFSVRIIRALGVFGFLGGITNWIAIEMLFRRIPFLIGTGIFAKKYREIRDGLKNIVVETLFAPTALKIYFTGRQKSLREIFQLEHHFGGLLDSDATNRIVDKKVNAILARPEGVMLSVMGVDEDHMRDMLKRHIHSFLQDISPTVLDKISSSGLADGVGLQAEVEKILEERIEDLTSKKVNQIISAMIRKHLNWLIVWGNVLGALAGVISEAVAIVAAKYTNT